MNQFNEDTFLDEVFELKTVEDAYAPASLLKTLHQIPTENAVFSYRKKYTVVAALLLVGLFIFGANLIEAPESHLPEASALTIEQSARKDMALAFHYIERSNRRVSQNIQSTLNTRLQQHTLVPVAEPMLNTALKATTSNTF